MKKQQKTFADRAKELKKKFPRAEWDAIERKDLNAALRKLRDEQEEFKTIMGIAEGANQQDEAEAQGPSEEMEQEVVGGTLIPGKYMGSSYAMGGVHNYAGEGTSYLPRQWNAGNNTNIPRDTFYGNQGFDITNQGFVPQKASLAGINAGTRGMQSTGYNKPPVNTLAGTANPSQFKYRSPSNSFLPFGISGAASMIGDVAGLVNMNRNMPRNVNLPRVTAQNISLQPQREALQRTYNTATNVALRNSRDVSNPANAYANQLAGISGLTESYGTQMGQSWMNEANTNVQARNQAMMQNADLASREALQNAELQSRRAQMQGQYIESMAQTVPSMFRDYRAQVADTNLVNNMGKDYGQYEMINPNEKPIDKILANMFGRRTYTVNRNNPQIAR